MYSETITLFNKHSDKLGDMWYPHLLTGVDLIIDRSSVIAKYGAETASSAKLHIKYIETDNGILIDSIPYIGSREWHNLTNEEKKDYITFNTDSANPDFFVIGDIGITEPVFDSVDAYNSLVERLNSQVNIYTLITASEPYKVIKHFEIMAKG